MKSRKVFVTQIKENIPTRYGERTVIEAIDCGETFTIWRGVNDPYASSLFTGDEITVAIDSKGKANLIVPSNENTAIVPVKTEKLETTPAVCPQISKLAQIMAQCVTAIRNELPGLDPESEQKYATSLFIQACKEVHY